MPIPAEALPLALACTLPDRPTPEVETEGLMGLHQFRNDDPIAFLRIRHLPGEIERCHMRRGQRRGVHIIDVGNPGSPRELGRLNLKDGAFGLSVKNRRAYIAGDKEGFFVADVSDSKTPFVVGRYSPKDGITENVSINGNYAYVVEHILRLGC